MNEILQGTYHLHRVTTRTSHRKRWVVLETAPDKRKGGRSGKLCGTADCQVVNIEPTVMTPFTVAAMAWERTGK